jgi:K+-transporting ATPase ATPase B chain
VTTTLEKPVLVRKKTVTRAHLVNAVPEALRKFHPRHQLRNPVMFVVWAGSLLVTVFAVTDPSVFTVSVMLWLWFTVLFANLAEAVAEGRGKAQAESLRKTKKDTVARLVNGDVVAGTELKIGDLVVVEAGEIIPGDGDVVEGIATVDESAITGRVATGARSPVARPCCRTGSS